MKLHELKSPKGSRKKKKVVGRGRGCGRGKTSGRGENGQNARAGRGIMRGSEGGQIALIRRLPKVGFRSRRPVVYQVVKLTDADSSCDVSHSEIISQHVVQVLAATSVISYCSSFLCN